MRVVLLLVLITALAVNAVADETSHHHHHHHHRRHHHRHHSKLSHIEKVDDLEDITLSSEMQDLTKQIDNTVNKNENNNNKKDSDKNDHKDNAPKMNCDEPDKDENGKTKFAMLIPTTTHNLPPIKDVNDLPFMKFFYDTFRKTYSKLPNVEYHLYLGYDAGDAYYDNAQNLEAFKHALVSGDTPLRDANVHLIKLKKDKLTQLWNQLFQTAYDDGCHYFYQIGDDVQLQTPGWTEKFISVLQANPTKRNFGIVGPRDGRAPQKWQEQAVVHRSHYQAFRYLFDPAFADGSCDVWLAQAYGKADSFLLDDVVVINQIRIIRYQAHSGNLLVGPRVKAGRERACEYMRQCSTDRSQNYCDRVSKDEIVGTLFAQLAERVSGCPRIVHEYTVISGH